MHEISAYDYLWPISTSQWKAQMMTPSMLDQSHFLMLLLLRMVFQTKSLSIQPSSPSLHLIQQTSNISYATSPSFLLILYSSPLRRMMIMVRPIKKCIFTPSILLKYFVEISKKLIQCSRSLKQNKLMTLIDWMSIVTN